MTKPTLLASALMCAIAGYSQEVNITSWTINTDGTNAKFYVNTSLTDLGEDANVQEVCYDDDFIYVQTQGLAEIMGPCLNPGSPSGQDHTWKIPRNAAEETGTKTEVPDVASIGVCINGVAIYGKGDARSYDPGSGTNQNMGAGIWNGEAYYTEGFTLDDKYSGHPQQQGEYHTHATPSDLYEASGSNTHSPIIGWAWDGYPVYGPYGYTNPNDANSAIKRMETGYALRSITQRHSLPDGTVLSPPDYGPDVNTSFPIGSYIEDYEYTGNGDLDEYNGRECVTPEYPSGTYAYFVTMDANGDPAFPYFIGTHYYGQVESSNIGISGGHATIPSSADCFEPLALAEVRAGNRVAVYPNPSHGLVNFDGPGVSFKTLDVIDYTGRIVFSEALDGLLPAKQVDLSHLPSGTYVVRLSGPAGIENKSVVLHH